MNSSQWRSVRRRTVVSLIGGILLGAPGSPVRAASPEQIDKAVSLGMDFLRKEQDASGTWERPGSKPKGDRAYSGYTAIAASALLAAGEHPTTPQMAKAIKFLQLSEADGMYGVAERAQVWGLLKTSPEVKQALGRDGRLLLTGMKAHGLARGMYHYFPTEGGDAWDTSVSQLAILGMWSMETSGYEVPGEYWVAADQAWRSKQFPDGGWCYRNEGGGEEHSETAAMTAAGVATLFITDDEIRSAQGLECRGNAQDPDIEKGLKWMGDHFSAVFGDIRAFDQYYALYGVERIGLASGRKYLGVNNWFDAGSDWLVLRQNKDGSWGQGDGALFGGNYHNIPDTSFALLFLSHGRAPVMMNKLQYDGPWNQRSRDLANVVRWSGRQIEQDLNWQSTPLSAPPEELHDAPILYIAGNKPLNFSADDKAKLRRFALEGGMIFGNADCKSPAFAESFKQLGQELFPTYEFRNLPADHPIFTHQLSDLKSWKTRPVLLGLGNGVRELMLTSPGLDCSRAWQTNSFAMQSDSYQLGIDLFLYATDKQPMQRDVTYLVKADPKVKPDKSLKVARLSYGGNWDPEPGGWERLATVMHNLPYKANLAVDTVKLGDGKLAGYKIAHLTGNGSFSLPAPAKAELKAFVDQGGTLIVDAAGGSTEFGGAVEGVLEELFPDAGDSLKTALPPDHNAFAFAGKPAPIAFRNWAKKILGLGLHEPRVRGWERNGRAVILYSPDDLSGALVGEQIDGIVGYTPDSGTALMADMLLYATGKK